MLWCCIIWDWTISATSRGRRGQLLAAHDRRPLLTCGFSAFMVPKQVEMDGIVERIYTAIETQPHLSSTLFILVGDHGMNDAGNHGGSGPGETSPALVFMSPKLGKVAPWYEWHGDGRNQGVQAVPLKAPAVPRDGEFGFYNTIEQSDLAPTIALLLGIPVPRNNLGVFIPEFVHLWNCIVPSQLVGLGADVAKWSTELLW